MFEIYSFYIYSCKWTFKIVPIEGAVLFELSFRAQFNEHFIKEAY